MYVLIAVDILAQRETVFACSVLVVALCTCLCILLLCGSLSTSRLRRNATNRKHSHEPEWRLQSIFAVVHPTPMASICPLLPLRRRKSPLTRMCGWQWCHACSKAHLTQALLFNASGLLLVQRPKASTKFATQVASCRLHLNRDTMTPKALHHIIVCSG